MKSLQSILFKRYGAMIVGLLFLTIVFYLGNFSSQFLNWRASEISAAESKVETKIVGSDSQIEASLSELPSTELFYSSEDGQSWLSQYFIEPTGLIQLFMMGILFLILFFDRRSGFDSFLYASRFSKKSIARQKILVLGVGALATFVLSKCLFWGLVFWKVDGQYMNLPWSVFFKQQLNSLAVSSVYFAVSIFAGFLLGELVTGVMTVYFLCATLHEVVSAIEELFLSAMGKEWWKFELETQTVMNLSGGNLYIRSFKVGAVLAAVCFSAILLWSAQKLASKVSLENDHNYLLLPKMRWTIMICMILYLMLLQLEVGLFHSSLRQLLAGECSLSYFLVNLFEVGLLGLVFSYLLIFRRNIGQGFRKIMFVKQSKT